MSEQKSKPDALMYEYERLKLTLGDTLLATHDAIQAIGEDGWRTHDPELLSTQYQAAERALDEFVERLVDRASKEKSHG